MTDFKIDNPAVLYLSGGTMIGVINQPNTPIFPLELTNKLYVDSLIASGVPDATTTLKGKIKLSGDLTGTADTPLVNNLAITNAKLANMTFTSQLKGSNSVNPAVTDIFLGTHLVMIGSTLNINTSSMPFLPLVGGTMSGSILQPITPTLPNHLTNKAYVDSQISSITVPDATTLVKGKIQLAGDLSGTASLPVISVGAVTTPKIANGAILNAKLANLSAISQLKGSSSASSTATDISLGTGLSMTGTTLNVDPSFLASIFLPLSGGTMSGAINQPLTPLNPGDLTNKMYVDSFFVPDATTLVKGKVQLAGDLTGTASAPLVANSSITNFKIANNTIINSNLAPMSATSQLKGSSSTVTSIIDISLGSNLSITGTTLDVNTSSLSGSFLPLAGGTMTGEIFQPSVPSSGNALANKTYVDTQISGSTPDATTIIKGKVQLAGDLGGPGTSAATPIVSNLAITNAKLANLSTVSQLKGSSSASSTATDISLGSNLFMTGSILNVNTASLSGTFLPLSGGTMSGAINQPSLPINPNELTNKTYVDSQSTPDATTLIKGKVQLAGDLTGTANLPTIAPLVVTTTKLNDNAVTNLKLANMSSSSQLKGSGSGGPTTVDISLGSNLTMTGTTLDVNTSSLSGSFLPLAGGTMTGEILQSSAPSTGNALANKTYVDTQISAGTPDATTLIKGKVQLAGDLGGTGTTAASPIISNLAVTNPKINPGGASTLKGTNSLSNVDDIVLGSGLSLTAGVGPTLSVNQTVFNKAGNTQFGVVEFNSSGDLTQTAVNSGIGVVKSLAITNPKVNPGGASTLKGTNSLMNVDDIILGSGLSLTSGISPTLSVNSAALNKAGNTQFGIVEFDSSGDLTQTAVNSGIGVVKPLAITNPKVNPGGASSLKGTNSLTNVDDIILGSGLSLTAGAGPTLSVDTAILNKAGAAQFGVVEFDPSGDLNVTFLNSGIGVVKPLAITNAKLANMSAISQLKGSGSGGTTTTDIALGAGLTMSGTNLFVDSTTLQKAGAAQFGVVEFDLTGDLTQTGVNSGIGVVKSLAITNTKLANLSAVSQLKGSSSASQNATDISLGTGLTMTGSTLNVDSTTIQKAGATQFGVVEFDPSGDLNATAANSGIGVVKPLAITNPKVNPGGASTLKGTNSLTNVDDIILGSGLSLTAGAGPTLSVNAAAIQKAGAAQFGVVEFDPSGDLDPTAANSGIGVVKTNAITTTKINNLAVTTAKIADVNVTNPKINPGGASSLKGTNSLTNVDDIILGSGLSLTAGAGPTLSVNQTTFDKAGAAQFGVIEFDPSGDLNATASNSGIGVVKPLAITNPKVNPGGASTLKGTNSLTNVDDIILGSGLSLTAGAGPTLSVNQTTFNKAGAAQFGVVQFDSVLGDLDPTAANSGIGVVKTNAITTTKINNLAVTTAKIADVNVTNPKINPGGASTLKGTNSLTNVDDIILGSGLSLTAGAGPTLSVTGIKTKNSSVARTLQTSTGAVGFQVSATQPANVYYSVQISTTIAVGGSSTGTVFLEVAPTNSAVAGDWVIDAQVSNNQSFAGLLTLSSTQVMCFELSTYVPVGYFVKLRTTSAGTASFVYQRGTEVLG